MYSKTAIFIAALVGLATVNAELLHHEKKKELLLAVSAAPKAAVSGAYPSPPSTMTADTLASIATSQITAPVVPEQCSSVYSLVSSSPDFSILKAAIEDTSLTSVFDNTAFVGTVFAPTDEAFTKLLDDLRIKPQEMFNDPVTLAVILKYHVIPGLALPKALLRDGQIYPTLLVDTKGNKYTIEFNADKVFGKTGIGYEYTVVPSGGKPAKVTDFDVNAGCPAVVHTIDRVLIPNYREAAKVETGGAAFSAFLAYQRAAEL